jgi:hypothetical protein
MRWMIEKAIADEISLAVAWTRNFLSTFDLQRLQWLRIDTGRGRYTGAYGRCWYPASGKGYRISIQVPGPFPYHQTRFVTPLYRDESGSWPEIPPHHKAAGFGMDSRSGREWIRLTTEYEMRDRSEAVVHIAAHEFFHFLRHSRQIPGRNTEIEADRFAIARVAAFRLQISGGKIAV